MAINSLGRPRKILDAEKITQLIGKGFTVQFVADYFDVHADTLYANYSDALRKGQAFREGCLQAKQTQKAMKGDTTLLIWLGKQWLGQTDKSQTEVIGKVLHAHLDFGSLSAAARDELRQVCESRVHAGAIP